MVIAEKENTKVIEVTEDKNSSNNGKTITTSIPIIKEADNDDDANHYITKPLGLIVERMGVGGMLGICSGYAIKTATRVAAVMIGGTFILLQSLQYAGYIEIKWDKIKQDAIQRIDSDGSGTLGAKDVKYYVNKFMRIMTYQGPVAGGFSAGLYLGFNL